MAFYEVQVSPTAGQGAFARVLIPEGTLIINEMPLMTVLRALPYQENQPNEDILSAFSAFSAEVKDQYLGLHPTGSNDDESIAQRFWKNCFGDEDKDIGQFQGELYLHISKLNHSCAPNVRVVLADKETMRIEAKALRDIEVGEELFLSYVDPEMGRNERRAMLAEMWGFECGCEKCVRGE